MNDNRCDSSLFEKIVINKLFVCYWAFENKTSIKINQMLTKSTKTQNDLQLKTFSKTYEVNLEEFKSTKYIKFYHPIASSLFLSIDSRNFRTDFDFDCFVSEITSELIKGEEGGDNEKMPDEADEETRMSVDSIELLGVSTSDK